MDNFIFHIYISKIKSACSVYLNEKLKDCGITASEGHYLGLLYDRGPLSQNDMTKVLGYDKGYTSRICLSLEERGLILPLGEGGTRNRLYEITALGQELSKEASKILDTYIDEVIFEGISQKERQSLLTTIKKVANNTKQILEKEKHND